MSIRSVPAADRLLQAVVNTREDTAINAQVQPDPEARDALRGAPAGIKAVSHTATTMRVDSALIRAFGLPGCAEQSVTGDTLDAATEEDVVALREAIADLFDCQSQAR